MKGKLITLSILSAFGLIGFIMVMTSLKQFGSDTIDVITNGENFHKVISYFGSTTLAVVGIIGGLLFAGTSTASLILGILVLTDKQENKEGTTIAAGILGIMAGMLGVNTIVAGIAAKNSK